MMTNMKIELVKGLKIDLMTKEIEKKAQAQFKLADDMNQLVVVKLFIPIISDWKWYIMNQNPENPEYLWGIVKGIDVEMGSMRLSELERMVFTCGINIQRDIAFNPIPAIEVWNKLHKGEFV
jgi:hypothetical protein